MKKTIVWLMNMVDIMGINYERETLISGYYFEPFDSDSFLIDVCDPGAKRQLYIWTKDLTRNPFIELEKCYKC